MDKRIAETVLERAAGYCERCGKFEVSPALHHRKLRSQGGEDAVENLVAICHPCHNMSTDAVHMNPAKAKVQGYIVPSWADPSDYPLHLADGTVVRLDSEGNYHRLD